MSMKKKLSGGFAHVNGVISPGVLLTLSIFNSKRVPAPDRGRKSSENADMRTVLIGPGPGRMFPETFQFPPVRPAFWIGELVVKLQMVSLKVKSPWNPT